MLDANTIDFRLGIHSVATLLDPPVQCNANQYSSSAMNSTLTKLITFQMLLTLSES